MPEKHTHPKLCPLCGSKHVVPIVYGLPSEKMLEEAREGRIALGGCGVFVGRSPAFECDSCGHKSLHG